MIDNYYGSIGSKIRQIIPHGKLDILSKMFFDPRKCLHINNYRVEFDVVKNFDIENPSNFEIGYKKLRYLYIGYKKLSSEILNTYIAAYNFII